MKTTKTKRVFKLSIFSMFSLLMAFSIVLSAFLVAGNQQVAYAVSQDINNATVATSGMLADIPGFTLQGNKVLYKGGASEGGANDAGDYASKWAYFPTKYLNITEPGAYDLSQLLCESIHSYSGKTDAESKATYNLLSDLPYGRFIGYEREGELALHNTTTEGLTNGGQGSNLGAWNNQGKGIFFNTNDTQFHLAIYFTIAVPESLNKNIKIRVKSHFKGWGNNKDRLQVGMAAYGTNSIDNLTNSFNDVYRREDFGLDHAPLNNGSNKTAPWTLNHSEVGVYNGSGMAPSGFTTIYNRSYTRFDANGDIGGDPDTGDVLVAQGTKFIRLLFTMENTSFSGNIQFLLSQLRFYIGDAGQNENYEYASSSGGLNGYNYSHQKDFFMPFVDNRLMLSDNFFLANESVKAVPFINYDGWKNDQYLDINKVGGAQGNIDHQTYVGDTVEYKDVDTNWWRYMFAYIEIPSWLANARATITVSADIKSYGDLSTIFSLTPGDKFYDGNAEKNATDLCVARFRGVSDAFGNTSVGVKENTYGFRHRTLSLQLKPTDKYVRISVANFRVTSPNVGQAVKNIKVECEKNPPVISNAQHVGNTNIISANVTDETAIERVNIIDKATQASQEMIFDEQSNKYKYELSKAGTYQIVAIDKLGNTSPATEIIVDNDNPSMGNPKITPVEGKKEAQISVNVTDNFGITKVEIVETGQIMAKSNNTYTATVTSAGNYTIIATDTNGATVQKIVQVIIDEISPEITDIIAVSNGGKNQKVSAVITDNIAVTKVQISYNGNTYDVTQHSGNTYYYFVANYEGDVVFTAYDKVGNKTISTPYRVDSIAPVITAQDDIELVKIILGDNSNAGSKKYNFTVTDGSKVVVTSNQYKVTNSGGNNYLMDITKNTNNLKITATDEYGNISSKVVKIGNIVSFNGFADVQVANDIFTVKVEINELGKSINENPIVKDTIIKKKISVGTSGVFTIQLEKNIFESFTINVDSFIESTKFEVEVETGKITETGEKEIKNHSIALGSYVNLEAFIPENDEFVCWMDERNVVVSRESFDTVLIFKDTKFRPIYVSNDLTKVYFTSLSGSIIDIKAGPYNTVETIRDNIKSYGVKDPENMFMTFVRWDITKKNDTEFVAKSVFKTNETVTVKYGDFGANEETFTTEVLPYNSKKTFLGNKNTVAWGVNDGKTSRIIAVGKDLTLHVTSDLTLYKYAKNEQKTIEPYISKKTDASGNIAVTGYVDPRVGQFAKAGFIIDSTEIPMFESKTAAVAEVKVYDKTHQAIINITSKLKGKKVRMFVLTSNHVYIYSNILVL